MTENELKKYTCEFGAALFESLMKGLKIIDNAQDQAKTGVIIISSMMGMFAMKGLEKRSHRIAMFESIREAAIHAMDKMEAAKNDKQH